MSEDDRGTLKVGEIHPCAHIALEFIQDHIKEANLHTHIEALASCSISGNRLAEICSETLRRLLDKEPVSDRYLMGLAWYFWQSDTLLSKYNKNKIEEF